MREILFRGKRLDNGEWVEGYCLKGLNEYFICTPKEGYVDINPSTLCQFTGLLDKDGAKIWEGDVVRSDYRNQTCIVRIGEAKYIGCGTILYGVFVEFLDSLQNPEPFTFNSGRQDWVRIGSIHDTEPPCTTT